MRKVIGLGALLTVMLVGCGKSNTSIMYSNLADEKSQSIVTEVLLGQQIEEATINTFLKQVDDYNGLVDLNQKSDTGFLKIKIADKQYDEAYAMEQWIEEDRNYSDTNSRIIAYELYDKFLNVSQEAEESDDLSLLFDFNIMDTNPLVAFSEENRIGFSQLFESVPVSATEKESNYGELIKQYWREKGIRFDGPKELSMINVFVENKDVSELFIGHAGIMVEVEGDYYFIEKCGPLLPYQASIWKSERDVYDYLLKKLEGSSMHKNKPYIIMKNNEVK